MRLFAADHFPRLAARSGDLPRPWVMPLGLPRGHRDRLAALLAQALRALDPGLALIQLRWAERHFLLSGRLALPSAALVWWRVNAVPVVDPQAAVLDGSRLTPGLALYDFDGEASLPADGWLGPLKMGVLHRIQDRLLDERPVASHEEIADAVRALSPKLISPIDLVDAAEAMVEVEAQGEGLEAAKAEAVGRVIAGRFAVGPADAAVRALVAVGRGEEPEDAGREALRRAGLADAGSLMPLLDLLREEQTLRRAVLRVAEQTRLTGSLAELAPGLFPEERVSSAQGGGVDVASPQALTRPEATSPRLPEPRAAVVRGALEHTERDDWEGASRVLLRALQQRQDRTWGQEDLGIAGELLGGVGLSEDAQRGQSMDAAKLERIATLYEAASELLERAEAAPMAIDMLLLAGWTRNLLYQWSAAEALFERGRALSAATGHKRGLATSLVGLSGMRLRMDQLQEAMADAEEAANLFRELGMPREEGEALRRIGDVRARLHDLDGAGEAHEAALALFENGKNPLAKAGALLSRGRVWQLRNDFKAAREGFEEALFHCREHELGLQEAQAHQALGELSLQRNEPHLAREAYEEAARLYHELDDRRGEATALERLGDVRASMNDRALARDAYDATLALVREVGAPEREETLLSKRAGIGARSGDGDGDAPPSA